MILNCGRTSFDKNSCQFSTTQAWRKGIHTGRLKIEVGEMGLLKEQQIKTNGRLSRELKTGLQIK